jgi:Domain of unknown function (DUF4232)
MRDRGAGRRPVRLLVPLLALLAAACTPTMTSTATFQPVTSTAPPTELASPSLLASPVPPSPTPGTPAPSAGPTPTAGLTGCAVGDLKASHGIVEGASGARLTSVVLESDTTCTVSAVPNLALIDDSQLVLATSSTPGPQTITLAPGGVYGSDVRFANWCGNDPAYPITLFILIGDRSVAVTGGSFPESNDMPPCLGTDAAELMGTPWTPSP